MIYFLAADAIGLAKIGFANQDVDGRTNTIRVSSPVELRLMGVVAGSQRDEKALHHALCLDRVRGEWFRMAFADAALADAASNGIRFAISQAESRTQAYRSSIAIRNKAGSEHFREALLEIVGSLALRFGADRVYAALGVGFRQWRNIMSGKCLPEAWRIFNLRSLDPDCLNELRRPTLRSVG